MISRASIPTVFQLHNGQKLAKSLETILEQIKTNAGQD